MNNNIFLLYLWFNIGIANLKIQTNKYTPL